MIVKKLGDMRSVLSSKKNTEFAQECGQLMKDAADEIERLKQWVSDCQSGMYINCVYCGHRYGPREDTPVAMADVLREHIEQCPEHPLSEAKAEIERLQAEVKENTRHAQFGMHVMTMLEGMTEPELEVGSDPVDGYIVVYQKQKKEIERLQNENKALRDVLETDRKPHHQLCLELVTLRNELLVMQDTEAAAEAAKE